MPQCAITSKPRLPSLVGAEKICSGMAKMAPVLVVRNTLVSMFRRMPLTASFKENIFQQPGGRNKGPGKLRTFKMCLASLETTHLLIQCYGQDGCGTILTTLLLHSPASLCETGLSRHPLGNTPEPQERRGMLLVRGRFFFSSYPQVHCHMRYLLCK